MDISQNIIDTVSKQHVFFNSEATVSFNFRIKQLKSLKCAIEKNEGGIVDALKKDLGKPEFESYLSEIGFVLLDLSHTIKHLKKWMKARKITTPFLSQPASSKIIYSPLGVNLIISPFNYPFGLTFSPLVAAIAAGNTVVVKTSELTTNVSLVIKKIIEETFIPEYVAYIEGEIPETSMLLEQKFDHVFFTGSPVVGSIVMQAAAKKLTPVTLELGGKSPCIVHKDANIDIAVKRIVYGKFMNAGQTCIAPDYVLVHEEVKDVFLNKLKHRIDFLYGKDPFVSENYGRIVNKRHHKRLIDLIIQEKVIIGGKYNREEKFISPTVMQNVTLDDAVMKDEVFGPILPVLSYKKLDEAFNVIRQLPQHPLAGYIFSKSKNVQDDFIKKIQFGGGCINNCLQHLGNLNLPFGGVGNSGMGSYHGFNGFEQFSHKKSILKSATWFDNFSLLYPPYNNMKLKLIKKLLR